MKTIIVLIFAVIGSVMMTASSTGLLTSSVSESEQLFLRMVFIGGLIEFTLALCTAAILDALNKPE